MYILKDACSGKLPVMAHVPTPEFLTEDVVLHILRLQNKAKLEMLPTVLEAQTNGPIQTLAPGQAILRASKATEEGIIQDHISSGVIPSKAVYLNALAQYQRMDSFIQLRADLDKVPSTLHQNNDIIIPIILIILL